MCSYQSNPSLSFPFPSSVRLELFTKSWDARRRAGTFFYPILAADYLRGMCMCPSKVLGTSVELLQRFTGFNRKDKHMHGCSGKVLSGKFEECSYHRHKAAYSKFLPLIHPPRHIQLISWHLIPLSRLKSLLFFMSIISSD